VSTIVDRVKGITLVHASAEEILSLHPDAVVLYAGTAPRLHVQLKTAGVPIIDVAWANSLADVRRITLALGRTLGEEPRARALLAAMDATLAAAGQARPPVRTLIYGPNGYATSDGVTEDIFARVGLINVASVTGETRDGTIPIESVVASPPELLLLSGADPNRPSFANLVLHHPALVSLARRIDVAQISLTPFLCPGPWSVDVAPKLAELGRQARALARAQTRP
jgi:iron complex transport system substrate-binding protein